MASEDDMTLGEVGRKLDDLRVEFREMKNGFVPRGEYLEHGKAQGERIGGVEKAVAKVEGTLGSINRIAWTGVVLPILATIVAAMVIAAVGLK